MITQTQPDTVWHWLYTNAPAAWLSALVAFVGLLISLKLRKRPRKVVVRELPTVSFLSIEPTMRHRIATTFDGHAVTALGAIGYELYNDGSEAIKDARVTLTLPAKTTFLQASTVPPEPRAECMFIGQQNSVSVTVPYLNPFREHKQTARVYVLADGELKNIRVSGSGEGWSIRHVPLPRPNSATTFKQAAASLLAAVVGAGGLYFVYKSDAKGVSGSGWWGFAGFLLLVGAMLVFAWPGHSENERLRRTVSEMREQTW